MSDRDPRQYRTNGDMHIVYVSPSWHGSERFDVYRCENGRQAWNIVSGVEENEARAIARVLLTVWCRRLVDDAYARVRNARDVEGEQEREWAVSDAERDMQRLLEKIEDAKSALRI